MGEDLKSLLASGICSSNDLLRRAPVFCSVSESMAPPSSSSPTFPSSDLSDREAVLRRQKKGPPFKFLVPLIYAPILPLIRISLRRNPVLRDRLFYGVLAGAFAHGTYLVTDLYDIESKR